MNMTTHIKVKRNRKNKNVTKAASIQFELKKRGLTQKLIAEDLHISTQAVSRAVNGQSTITRVDEWLYENLGLEAVNG